MKRVAGLGIQVFSAFFSACGDGGDGGRLWLFGGYGMTSTGYGEIFNDLWRYGK